MGLYPVNAHTQGVLDRLQESLADEYEAFAQVAAGGMGIVFKAEHRLLQRVDAIKVLFFAGEEADRERRRFYDEARIIAGLSHPNVRQVYGARYDRQRDLSYLLMAFIDGENLKERLRRELPSIHAGLSIAREVTQALQYAHSKRVIHRDIKPANILIDGEGHAFLADFGIALDPDVTQSNTVPGTLQYMAPELLQGIGPSAVTDIYSLGHVFSEIFTGRRHNGDFVEESDPGRGVHHYRARIDEDEVAEMLHDLVDRMTSRSAEARPRLCGEVLGRLDQVRRALKPSQAALAQALRKLPEDEEDNSENSEPRVTVTGSEDSSVSDLRPAPVAPMPALQTGGSNGPGPPVHESQGATGGSGSSTRDQTVVLPTVRPRSAADASPMASSRGGFLGHVLHPRFLVGASLVLILTVVAVIVSRNFADEPDAATKPLTPLDDAEATLAGEPDDSPQDSFAAQSRKDDSTEREELLEAEPIDSHEQERAQPSSEAPAIRNQSESTPEMLSGPDEIFSTHVRLVMSLPSEQVRMPLLRVWKKDEPMPSPTEFRGSISMEGRAGDVFVVQLLRRGLVIEPSRQEVVLDPRRTRVELRFEIRGEDGSSALFRDAPVFTKEVYDAV